MAIVRWRPARDLMGIQDEMNRMFERFFGSDTEGREMMGQSDWYPSVDISENKDEFVINAELPGLKKEDIHISFKEGNLIIEGERKAEKKEEDVNYHRIERSHGKFCRTFQLPSRIEQDKISASYQEGILNVKLPKSEESKPREIEVKVS
ncbi:MAG: Hsp20/alpha crystallin family protein [Calditrichia bacterium]